MMVDAPDVKRVALGPPAAVDASSVPADVVDPERT